MNDQPPRNRLAELSEQVRFSGGYIIVGRLYKFEQSLKIFVANFAELEAAIARTLETYDLLDIRDTIKRRKLNDEMTEIVRHLHNTVAASLSLVDHTRVFYRAYYRENNTIPDFQAQIKKRFAEDGLSQFVKCLRQFCQHYRMPLIGASMYFDDDGGGYRQSVELTTLDLIEFSGWSSYAKTFINSQPSRINLLSTMRSYREHVLRFHDWFNSQLIEVHRTDLDQYNEIMNEIDFIKSQDPLYRDYRPR